MEVGRWELPEMGISMWLDETDGRCTLHMSGTPATEEQRERMQAIADLILARLGLGGIDGPVA